MIQSPAGYQGDVRIKRYLDFYQAGYGVAMLSSGVAFSPLSLFANGEQGGWYDPSDLTTLFQDAAGTTPVTAVEQPVGRVLDKSGRGNHLSQSTAAARPVLSARVNQLTYTEQFDNAAWVTFNSAAKTGSATTTLSFASGADSQLYIVVGSNAVATTYKLRVEARTVTAGKKFRLKLYSINGGDQFSSDFAPTSSWQVFEFTSSSVPLSGGQNFAIANESGGGAGTIEFRYPDLRPANAGVGLPAYQRVGAATDYDTTGFPLYLKFDGTDDFLQSSTITPGSVDKAQVFAGVRKLSDATIQNIAEYGVDWFVNAGTLGLGTSGTTVDVKSYFFVARRSGNGARDATVYAAPITNVLSCAYDFAAATENDKITPRINGIVPTLSNNPATTGTGNFGSYALTVGRRGLGQLLFNGHLYSLILRFSAANLDAATITATETWVNGKTKAF